MEKTNDASLRLKRGEQLDRKQLKQILGGGPGGPAGGGCLECVVNGKVKESTWYEACGSMSVDSYCKGKYGYEAVGYCARECSKLDEFDNGDGPGPIQP